MRFVRIVVRHGFFFYYYRMKTTYKKAPKTFGLIVQINEKQKVQ